MSKKDTRNNSKKDDGANAEAAASQSTPSGLSSISGIISFICDAFFSSLFASLKDNLIQGAAEFVDMLQAKVLSLQKKMIRNAVAAIGVAVCVAMSIVSLLLALGFYLADNLHWPRYVIFLLVGVILLCIAALLKWNHSYVPRSELESPESESSESARDQP